MQYLPFLNKASYRKYTLKIDCWISNIHIYFCKFVHCGCFLKSFISIPFKSVYRWRLNEQYIIIPYIVHSSSGFPHRTCFQNPYTLYNASASVSSLFIITLNVKISVLRQNKCRAIRPLFPRWFWAPHWKSKLFLKSYILYIDWVCRFSNVLTHSRLRLLVQTIQSYERIPVGYETLQNVCMGFTKNMLKLV